MRGCHWKYGGVIAAGLPTETEARLVVFALGKECLGLGFFRCVLFLVFFVLALG